jgi:hypothetical protein
MIVHVLPGDATAAQFGNTDIEGERIVFREALIVGDVSGSSLDEFWDNRANFVLIEYGEDPIDYREKVAYELERLIDLPSDAEVNLWFEYELFCQANMWFCLDLLRGFEGKIYRVQPLNASPDDVWKGFGNHGPKELESCLEDRTRFTAEDIESGSRLWQAFRERDAGRLLELGEYRSPCFPFLKEVCEAAARIDSRPAEIVRELKASGLKEIDSLFPEFQKRAGVYGFGDLQVERLLETV